MESRHQLPRSPDALPRWEKDASHRKARREVDYKMFLAYLKDDEFVGADMARKFLQMGYTRARRYANYKGGRKYDKTKDFALRESGTGDPDKAESAAIFYQYWKNVEANKDYATRKKDWKGRYG